MRILIDTGTYNCGNLGDVAMLRVAVERASRLSPAASIGVIMDDAEALSRHCRNVTAVPASGRRAWLENGFLLGRLSGALPAMARRGSRRAAWEIRNRCPGLASFLVRMKMKLRGGDRKAFDTFLGAVESADVVVIAGQGGLSDHVPSHAAAVLGLLESAIRRGKPTAMFGQGIGPMRNPELLRLSRTVLPRVDLIALRESRGGLPLLESFGVSRDRIVTTGDDAIELAFRARRPLPGTAIGINLRVSPSAAVDDHDVERIRFVLEKCSRRLNAPVLPIPIARDHGLLDARTIRSLLVGLDGGCDGGQSLDTPELVCSQVGRCRIVVTGAYHAAVFALGQGIPAVCLARSDYVMAKFAGLADLFPNGCEVVPLTGDYSPQVGAAIHRCWSRADEVRSSLLESAAQQVQLGHAAYGRFWRAFGAEPLAHGSTA